MSTALLRGYRPVVPTAVLEVRKLQIEIAEAGMSRTVDQIQSTVQTLVESLPDPVIFYCLRDACDPLAALPVPPKERWWHKFAHDKEEQHGMPARLMQVRRGG